MSEKTGGTAFPTPVGSFGVCENKGMTLRDYFAAKAMQGLIGDIEVSTWLQADPRFNGDNFADVIAINAYEFADAMLKARDGEESEPPQRSEPVIPQPEPERRGTLRGFFKRSPDKGDA